MNKPHPPSASALLVQTKPENSSSSSQSSPLSFLTESFAQELSPHLSIHTGPGSGSYYCLTQTGLRAVAASRDLSLREAMILCLEHGIWPLRFKANRGLLSAAEQSKLLQSHVAVIGCGGLGGYAALLLARLGIGELTVCDNDCFDESNLNRQALCREDRIGMNKADAAARELALVASHVAVRVCPHFADADTLPEILGNADVVVDGLDNTASRFLVEYAAHSAGIPFIHGSLAGLEGFALASFPPASPSSTGQAPPCSPLLSLYGAQAVEQSASSEFRMGVPTPTPAAVAVMQAVLTLRVLLHPAPFPSRDPSDFRLWHLDLSEPSLETLLL